MSKLIEGASVALELALLLEKVADRIYQPLALLTIEAWHSTEPLPFALRKQGRKHLVGIGDTWGSHVFDCAWMRFRCHLPDDSASGDLVARIDVNGELCIVDGAGIPIRGLTNVKSTFDPELGGPSKTLFQLPSEMVSNGYVEFWADAGLNDLFGFVKDEGRIVRAEIVVICEEIRQLYYDLETLIDWFRIIPKNTQLAQQLSEALACVEVELDLDNLWSVARTREMLAPWFSDEKVKPALQVSAIGHAHLDLAWLWPIRETIRKGARTFASALYNIDRYPEYIFGMSQPQLYAWMQEHYPDLYLRIKTAVADGRIEPQGTFWVEPDCSMPSGEAYVRQVLHGTRFFKEEFGIVPRYCWQPDVFGYHGQLPQILKKSGHDYFMTQKLSWNVVNRFEHHSFQWEGIDGTRILTHMLPEETYNGPAMPRSLRKVADGYFEKDRSNHALMAFGIGDGGGGPDAEHLERLRRAPKLPGLPSVKIEKVETFLETWSKDADAFPIWRGELYLERHQGTLTTQALVKRNNRRAEVALRELEWAAYLAVSLADVAYPVAQLDRLWKEVLLYQFHDILPGSSIKRVYDECNARYTVILAELFELTSEYYAAVAAKVAPRGERIAFNSLPWSRSEWIEIDGEWCHVDVPALSWAIVRQGDSNDFARLQASTRCLENEKLRVTFADDGRIASVFEKCREREVLAACEFGNELIVLPDLGDAWDFEIDHEKKDVWGYLRGQVERPKLREATAVVDGPCAWLTQIWEYRSSKICQTIRLFSGTEQLEFETEVDWHEPAMMLRVRFPVAVQTDEARFEIPFGHIRRSTLEDTSQQRAQIEVAALQWVDLSQHDHGVALYNDCKYGFRIKGHVIDMTLLRSVPHPGGALIDKNDRADASGAVYTDLGQHAFRYVLRPHSESFEPSLITAEARALNTPLFLSEKGGGISNVNSTSLIQISSPEIELATVKLSEDGNCWVLRLVNISEESVRANIRMLGDNVSWIESDLVEQTLGGREQHGNVATLSFEKFEIKTLMICKT